MSRPSSFSQVYGIGDRDAAPEFRSIEGDVPPVSAVIWLCAVLCLATFALSRSHPVRSRTNFTSGTGDPSARADGGHGGPAVPGPGARAVCAIAPGAGLGCAQGCARLSVSLGDVRI